MQYTYHKLIKMQYIYDNSKIQGIYFYLNIFTP